MRSLAILGSTGSIGTQTLEVAASCGHRVLALTAHHNIDLLERQARTFHPILAAAADPTAAAALASRLADTDIQVLAGEEGVLAAAQLPQADTAVTALVGISDRKEDACGQKCMRCTKPDCPFRAGPAEVLREP